MAGRAATDRIIQGKCAISVNDPGHPLPPGWRRVRLTDVAELGTGHTPSRNHPAYWDGGVAWVGIRDAGACHGKVIHETTQNVSHLGLANSAARLLPKDTICLSRTASVGYVVKLGREMATSQDFVTWTCGPDLDPDYLMKALLAEGPGIRRFGEGSTHTTIYFPEVKAFHLDLPPIAEQRRIVTKLDTLNARLVRARAELNRVAAMATALRRAALDTAFAEASQFPTKIVGDLASAMFDGPFGSNLKSADYTLDGARVVRLENIGHLKFISEKETFVSVTKATGLARHRLAAGDILFSSFVDREVRVCLYPDEGELMAINKADCFVIRVDRDAADPTFLMMMLAGSSTYEAMKAGVHGATRPRIGLSLLRNYEVPSPPIAAQRAIAKATKAAFARADRMEAEAARARALLDRLEAAILARAFRGELVPQDPDDEPASVLLDRIRSERVAAPRPKRGRRAAVGA